MSAPAAGAYFSTPGPKEVYARFRTSAQGNSGTDWQFVGTCETAPLPSTMPKFIDVMNDYGGRSVATQLIWDGSESRLVCTLNRVDLNVCRNIRDQPRHLGLPGTVGKETNLSRGSLVIGVNDFEIAFKNTYFGTANATPGMVPGRYYYSAVLEAYEEDTRGTRVETVTMAFRMNNIFLGTGGFAQYTEDPGEFPNLTPT